MAKVETSVIFTGQVVLVYPECPYAVARTGTYQKKEHKHRCSHPDRMWDWCDTAHIPKITCPFDKGWEGCE